MPLREKSYYITCLIAACIQNQYFVLDFSGPKGCWLLYISPFTLSHSPLKEPTDKLQKRSPPSSPPQVFASYIIFDLFYTVSCVCTDSVARTNAAEGLHLQPKPQLVGTLTLFSNAAHQCTMLLLQASFPKLASVGWGNKPSSLHIRDKVMIE